ncbi:MAG: hypothetical protein RBR97_19830, partial [Bacteroidales bacterium]|nr:hypothetical protein [Bacteroidales bacterium]
HNFFIKRTGGTTATERFFDNKPREMFDYILETVSIPESPPKRGGSILKTSQYWPRSNGWEKR